MMEKYGTYHLFINKETGEEKRIPEAVYRELEMEKVAELGERWEEMKEDKPEEVAANES